MAEAARWTLGLLTRPNLVVWGTALLIGLAGGVVIVAIDRTRPAVVLTDLRETDGLAVQGGRLNILIGQDKMRDCPTVTSRFLWRWVPDPGRPGHKIPFQIPLVGPAVSLTPVGKDQRSILSLPLPSDIEEGDGWMYQSKSMRDCGLLPSLSATVVTQSPSVPLRVLTAKEAEGLTPQEGTVTRPDLRP